MSQVLAKLPKDLQPLVTVEDMPNKIVIRTRQFLEVETFILPEFLAETSITEQQFWDAVHQLRSQGVPTRVQGNIILVGGS
jgi:hypothetical protein